MKSLQFKFKPITFSLVLVLVIPYCGIFHAQETDSEPASQAPDLSAIPSIALKRVEVLFGKQPPSRIFNLRFWVYEGPNARYINFRSRNYCIRST
ncbi:MAG: hypothetical protein F4039_09605 [Gammaproteobacteria bacterium]|nr:hypothetical protein [Gammaproteobacteria bacterium]MYK44327.1 hypothetical protein [Gammaproteobacteria bacterium]